jgi:hypothetical protein
MFKATIPGLLNKSRTLVARRFGSETQNLVAQMIFNDDVNVLTTFDMNRVASFTFGDRVCGEIFEMLEHCLRNPLEFTVLSLHKTLVLLHHLAIYASQKAANNVWILKPHIKPLLNYNTVLMAQSEPKSIMAKIQKIKGGSVDRGQPVRQAAKVLFDLLSDVEMFKKVRETSADPDSLVPVGHHEQVGFVSDEVRKATLEEKLQKQHDIQIKSNLKDGGKGGFGSHGQTVIGAAHSMEEMLKMAMKNKTGYRDGNLSPEEAAHQAHLRQLEEDLKNGKFGGDPVPQPKPEVVDLLDFGNNEVAMKEEIPKVDSVGELPYEVANEDPYVVDSSDEADAQNDEAHDPFDPVQPPMTNDLPKETASSTHADDLLSLSMTGMNIGSEQNSTHGSTSNLSEQGGLTANVAPTVPDPMSAFDALAEASVPDSGLSTSVHSNSSGQLPIPEMPPAPPAPPAELPPSPPAETPPGEKTADNSSPPSSDNANPMNAAMNMMGNMGMNMNNTSQNNMAMNPMMMMGNPMMMQQMMQNMQSMPQEQQAQFMQQMMMMNQQMMQMMMQNNQQGSNNGQGQNGNTQNNSGNPSWM